MDNPKAIGPFNILTLSINFACFYVICRFFKINFFQKILSGELSECFKQFGSRSGLTEDRAWMLFLSSADFSKLTFQKILSGTLTVLNGLDPNQARHYVGPDLAPNGF